MLDKYEAKNGNDKKGNPAGGTVKGVGLQIKWQNGPLGRGKERKEPNGAFVETVISSVTQRIEFYQKHKLFKCKENERAILHLREALSRLNVRTKRREGEGVEGTHKGK